MNVRRSLTPREKSAIIKRQDDRCAMCGLSFSWAEVYQIPTQIQFDHWTPVALGNDAKPDAAMHKRCHARKTKRDVAAIAKVKRLQRKAAIVRATQRKEENHARRVQGMKWAWQKRKMQSRGFDKRLRRKMDGTTEKRT